MIDERKLIEDLQNYCGKQPYLVSENIWEIINSQPKIGDWIPCRMELPKSEEWQIRTLLVTVQCKNNTFVSTASFDCSNRKWLVDKGKEVIAWKPLPKIYAEK